MISVTAVIRLLSSLLFLAAAAFCVLLALEKHGVEAVKLGWIAALLILFAVNPTRLPPLGVPIAALPFYRAMFAALSVLLIAMSVFVIFFIQFPHERIPHYRGTVVKLLTQDSGSPLPEVRYDSEGQSHTFIDRMAPVLYPNRRFTEGEGVSVILIKQVHPRIDEPPLVRWSTPALIVLCALFMTTMTLVAHLRYLGAVT